jgi:hypothetical protein
VVSREKGWVQVASPDGSQTGWIYEKLLDPSTAPQQPGLAQGPAPAAGTGQPQSTGAGQEQPQAETVKVARPGAKVLSGPSDEATMLFGFPEGRELLVLSRESGWVQIMDPESKQAGWIAENSLAPAAAEEQQQAAARQRPSRSASHPRGRTERAEVDDEWLLAEEEESGAPNDIIEQPRRPRKWGRRGGRLAGGPRRAFRLF